MIKKVYYHDTDCGGVVYYANYLKYLEEARTEFFAEKGFPIKDLVQGGTLFAVVRQEIDYKSPSFYGDLLEIFTWIGNIGAARIEFESEIKNQNGQLIVKAKTVLVCVNKALKPQRLPEEIRSRISP